MKLKFGDYIVAGAVVLLAIASLIIGLGTKTAHNSVEAQIYQNGKLIQVIKLSAVSSPKEIKIDGAVHNTLLAEKGRIRYVFSDCPDKTCVHTGWLANAGQTAACLPNRTLVKLIGYDSEEDVVLN